MYVTGDATPQVDRWDAFARIVESEGMVGACMVNARILVCSEATDYQDGD